MAGTNKARLSPDAGDHTHAWSLTGEHKRWNRRWPWNRHLTDQKVFGALYPGVDPCEFEFARNKVEP